jgi:hypothetical protein
MKRLEIEIDSKYNLWTIQEEKPSITGRRYVIARCECGNEKLVNLQSILKDKSKSCGCVGNERISNQNKSHKQSKTPEYIIWKAMKARCKNLNNKYYGGKGIMVCDRWINSFTNFLVDMGKMPEGYSIDRIDSDGNYEPSNCRWADKQTQINNRKKYNKSGK